MLPPKVYRIVCKQVNSLHTCKCSASFNLLLENILKSWEKYPKFKKYFIKQWITSPSYSNCQIYKKPKGLASTNGPEESYNNKFKTLFTDKIRYHMIPALEKFETAIEFESDDKREFITDISKEKKVISHR